MGIKTFRRKLVELLQTHAHEWVKDVPEELLTFSFFERSVSFQHLDLQERFLENFGIKLPLVIHRARLDNVVVTAVSSHVVRLEVDRIILHGEVLPQAQWMDELQAARELEESYKAVRLQKHEEAATGSTNQQAAAGGLLCMAPGLEIEVLSAELVIQDRLTRPELPFALAATSSRVHLGTPFSLQNTLPTDRYVMHLDIRLAQYKMFCSNLPPTLQDPTISLHHFIAPCNCILGPCDEMQLDLRISSAAEMYDEEHMPRPSPAPSGFGHEVAGEEMLPMVSLAIRTTDSSLCFSQRQLANLIKHGRMWGTWFMCAQTWLDRCPPEEACKTYREGWLARCSNLTTAESNQGVDQDLVAFEEKWPYREVLRQRALAIVEMKCLESDASDLEPVERWANEQIECTGCEKRFRDNVSRERKEEQGVCPRDPMHATTFLLDVEVSNTVIELRSESVLGSDSDTINSGSMTLRVVPLDESAQTVRYLLHVDNGFDTQPISNELWISNCRAEFVDRKGNTPLIDCDTLYKFWDIVEHTDSLLCPEQPRRRAHVHMGNLRMNLMLPSLLRAISLVSGSMELAEIEDDYWDVFSALDLKSHCVQVARFYADMPSPQRCQRVSDIRMLSTDTASFLIWPEASNQHDGTEASLWQNLHMKSYESIDSAFQRETSKAAAQGMVVLQMKLSCRSCKDCSRPFELGRQDVAAGDVLGEVLSLTVPQLILWRPAELPEEALPAAGSAFWNTAEEAIPADGRGPESSLSVMLHSEEICCDISMLSMVVRAKPVVVQLSVHDVALLASIAEWWRLQTSRLAKGDFDSTGGMLTSQSSLMSSSSLPDSMTYSETIVEESEFVEGVGQEDVEIEKSDFLRSSATEDKRPASTPEFERKVPKSLALETEDEEEYIESIGLMREEVPFHVRVNIEKLSLCYCQSSTEACPLELQLDKQQLDVRLTWGTNAVEELTYSLHHVSIMDAKRQQYLLYCGGRLPANNMRWRDSCGAHTTSRRRRHDAIDFQARAISAASSTPAQVMSMSGESALLGGASMEVHLHIQPLWICAQWDSIVDTCTCLFGEIQELLASGDIFDGQNSSRFAEAGSYAGSYDSKSEEDLDAPSHPLNTVIAALESLRLQFTLQQIVLLVPCNEANTLQICGRLNLTARGRQLKMMACGLYMAIPSPPQNSEFGSEVQFRENAILHPGRLRLYVDCNEEGLDAILFDAVLRAEPLRFSICTKHVVVINALVQTLTELLTDLAARFLPIKETWRDDSALPVEEPPALYGTTWKARLQVHLEMVSIGLVDSELDVELCMMLLEDSSIMLQTCLGQDEDDEYEPFPDAERTATAMTIPMQESMSASSLDKYQTTSRSTPFSNAFSVPMRSPAQSATSAESQPGWPVTVDIHIRAISINMCQGKTSRPFPLLEPVRLHIHDLGAGKSHCSISWINANLSSTVVDVLTTLYLQVSKEPKSQPGATSYKLELEDKSHDSNSLSFARLSSPEHAGWRTLYGDGSSALIAPPLGLDWPTIRVHNHLGQSIELRSGGYEEVGIRMQDIMLRMNFPTGEVSEVCLRPSPPVQVLDFGKKRHSTRELVGNVFMKPAFALKRAATRSFGGVTRGEIFSHILVRREPAPYGNIQEIHLSSVMFIENRCNMDFIVVPVCPGCVSQSDQLAEPHRDPIVLPAHSKPRPVPLGWLTLCGCAQCVPEICCGLAARYLDAPTMETRRKLVQQGRLQPVMNNDSWKGILRYRSQVAGDYYLTASSLRLPHADDADAKTTHLCANIYGISQDLDAMHSALFFTVALEPLVQFCNRLCCPLTLHGIGSTLEPGVDASILHDMGIDLKPEIETATKQSTRRTLVHQGVLKLNKICRHGKESICFREHRPRKDTSLTKDTPPRFRRQQSLFRGNQEQVLEAVLCKEPGLEKHSSWSEFNVYPYKPQSYRIIIFTRYWVVNRRSDCNIFIPHGYSANYARDRNTELLQVPCCSRRMLPEQALCRGRIRLGLYDHWNDSHGHQYVPVTGTLNVSQPTEGSVRMPRRKRNPRSISFGYTVQAAPGPFYRTLVIELARRYTLVNNKNTAIFIHEKGDENLAQLHMIQAGQVCQTFDPQWNSLQLAIAGWSTSGKDVKMKHPRELQFSAYFSIDLEDKQDRFHLHHQHHEHYEDKELMMYKAGEGSIERDAKTGEVLPVSNRYIITVVDIKIEQGAVIISFSEAVRPIFRIVNRTRHTLQLKQDCAEAPTVHLLPTEYLEEALDFAWFNPWRDRLLEIWKDDHYKTGLPEKQIEKPKFDIEQVQKHPQLLKVCKVFAAMQPHMWEEFTVHTKVNNGCREVHIRPWCRVVNRKEGTSIFVQASPDMKGEAPAKKQLIELVEGEDVCMKPMRNPIPGSRSETLALHISSARNIEGSVILLKARHAGQKRYVHHRKRNDAAHGDGKDNNENNVYEVTEVVVQRDPISDFLTVELRDCNDAPYVVENKSRGGITMTMALAADMDHSQSLQSTYSADMQLPAGKLGKFIPHCWNASSSSCKVKITSSISGSSTIVDLERAGEVDDSGFKVRISSGRPRRIVIKDSRQMVQKTSRHNGPRLRVQSGRSVITFVRKAIMSPIVTHPHLPSRKKERLVNNVNKAMEGTKQLTRNALHVNSPHLSIGNLRQMKPMKTINKIGRLLRTNTWGLTSKTLSDDGTYSNTDSLCTPATQQTSSRLIECLTPSRKTHTRKDLVEEPDGVYVRFEGVAVALLDSMGLREVAYVCVGGVKAFSSKEGLFKTLMVSIDAVQVDVRDRRGTGRVVFLPWRPGGVWKTKRRKRKSQHLINFSARWRLDGDPKTDGAGHLDLQDLTLKVLPLEVRMDTEHLFVVAEWACQMWRSFLPLYDMPRQKVPQDQEWQSLLLAMERAAAYKEGDENDPVVGEPRWKERAKKEDFKTPTPIFVKNLEIKKIEVVVSWRFSGRQRTRQDAHSELTRWHYILKKALPFDLSQASIYVGRHRFGVGRRRVTDITRKDLFQRNGVPELMHGVLEQYQTAIFYQAHRIMFSQNLFLNVPRFLADVQRASKLAAGACVNCKPKLFLAAMFLMVAAFWQSCEEFFMTLAKTLCHYSLYRTPNALRREPSGLAGIVYDAAYYSFGWHLLQVMSEWHRLIRHARSARSCSIWLRLPLLMVLRFVLAMVCSVVLIVAKLLQFLHLFFRLIASRLSDDKSVLLTPSLCRAGPQQYYMGAPLQFSQDAAAVLNAAGFYGSQGQRFSSRPAPRRRIDAHDYWRMMRLPDDAGLLLAVKGRGFCLVCDVSCEPALRTRKRNIRSLQDIVDKGALEVLWEASGGAWKPPELLVPENSPGELPLIGLKPRMKAHAHHESRRGAGPPPLLKLGSWPAVMTAYGFIRDFIATEAG